MNQCLEPEESCDEKAIRAHSIANSGVLKRMSDKGHVMMFRPRFRPPRPPEIRAERVGRNSATTFTGLCGQHDNELFAPIDDQVPNIQNQEHLFLLAYRATLRESHVAMDWARRAQHAYLKRIDIGLSSDTDPDASGIFAVKQFCKAYECYQFKREFDRNYLSREWPHLEHHIVILTNQPPSIAVSSLFSLDDVDAPELPRVALNVFPVEDDVVAVFSAVPRDAPFAYTYLQPLLDAESHFQKYLLSKLVLQHCDNFVIHPGYYESMTNERQHAICRFFAETILKNKPDHEDPRLFLF